MSLERALDTLVSLGLTRTEAKVYVFLAKKGSRCGKELANALRLTQQQLYRSLKNLQGRGMISATLEYPIEFSAVPLEKVIDLLVKVKIEQAKALQENREVLLSSWRSIVEKEFSNS